jgi:hypothetical protein
MTHIVPQNLPRDEAGEAIRARVFGIKAQMEAPGTGYQPLDAQLTDLAALSYGGNALKVVRVNAGETSWELATVSGGGGGSGSSYFPGGW